MKIFQRKELQQAIDHATNGGQALHLDMSPGGHSVFPAGRAMAHLFDQDRERLTAAARGLGVRRVKIERDGTPKQHVDLCGEPLNGARRKAWAESNERLDSWLTLEIEELGLMLAAADALVREGNPDAARVARMREEERRKVLIGFLHACDLAPWSELMEGLGIWYEAFLARSQ